MENGKSLINIHQLAMYLNSRNQIILFYSASPAPLTIPVYFSQGVLIHISPGPIANSNEWQYKLNVV